MPVAPVVAGGFFMGPMSAGLLGSLEAGRGCIQNGVGVEAADGILLRFGIALHAFAQT